MRPILDILGACCPMGCGRRLHLMPNGMIECLDRDCPDRGAAQKILCDPETEHVVTFGEDTWNVKHPLRERVGDELLSCQAGEFCLAMDGPPGGVPGKYRLVRGGDGEFLLERA